MAFPANHAPGLGAMLYSIATQEGTVFYGTDTGTLFDSTWEALRRHNMQFDLVILDHTYGPEEPGSDHLCAHQVIEHANRLRDEGMLTARGRIFATHIAHEGNPPHPDLVNFAAQHRYEVAYDGLAVMI